MGECSEFVSDAARVGKARIDIRSASRSVVF